MQNAYHACFSADGRRVLTASKDGAARMWDALTGKALIPPLRHQDRVVQDRVVVRGVGLRVGRQSDVGQRTLPARIHSSRRSIASS